MIDASRPQLPSPARHKGEQQQQNITKVAAARAHGGLECVKAGGSKEGGETRLGKAQGERAGDVEFVSSNSDSDGDVPGRR